jgi:hypothetical protein
MGQELSAEVFSPLPNLLALRELKYVSEIFGASEDDSPEVDHSEDSENRSFYHLDCSLYRVTDESNREGNREAASRSTSIEKN